MKWTNDEITFLLENYQNMSSAKIAALLGRTQRSVEKQASRIHVTTKNEKHGLSKHKLYKVWRSIIHRCYAINGQDYHRYGGRGIDVNSEWRHSPQIFIDYCISIGWKEGLTIDRIDNNFGYHPGNIRFVDMRTQSNNKRNSYSIEQNLLAYKYAEMNLGSQKLFDTGKFRGVSISSVRNLYAIFRILFTSSLSQDEKQVIISMVNAGMSCKKIFQVFDKRSSAINYQRSYSKLFTIFGKQAEDRLKESA